MVWIGFFCVRLGVGEEMHELEEFGGDKKGCKPDPLIVLSFRLPATAVGACAVLLKPSPYQVIRD